MAQAADTRPSTATPAAPAPAATAAPSGSADANKLIGQDIKNAENDSIGEVKSVRIGADGKLRVSDDGRKVTAHMTKDQLKALQEYKYPDASSHGRVFTDATPRVLLGWKDLKVGRQQDKLVLTTQSTKDSLKAIAGIQEVGRPTTAAAGGRRMHRPPVLPSDWW